MQISKLTNKSGFFSFLSSFLIWLILLQSLPINAVVRAQSDLRSLSNNLWEINPISNNTIEKKSSKILMSKTQRYATWELIIKYKDISKWLMSYKIQALWVKNNIIKKNLNIIRILKF